MKEDQYVQILSEKVTAPVWKSKDFCPLKKSIVSMRFAFQMNKNEKGFKLFWNFNFLEKKFFRVENELRQMNDCLNVRISCFKTFGALS